MPTIAINIDKDKLRDFCRRWKITEFALFGSVTRRPKMTANSSPCAPKSVVELDVA